MRASVQLALTLAFWIGIGIVCLMAANTPNANTGPGKFW